MWCSASGVRAPERQVESRFSLRRHRITHIDNIERSQLPVTQWHVHHRWPGMLRCCWYDVNSVQVNRSLAPKGVRTYK